MPVEYMDEHRLETIRRFTEWWIIDGHATPDVIAAVKDLLAEVERIQAESRHWQGQAIDNQARAIALLDEIERQRTEIDRLLDTLGQIAVLAQAKQGTIYKLARAALDK